jgi:zinc protease
MQIQENYKIGFSQLVVTALLLLFLSAPLHAMPRVQRTVLPNGLVVLLSEEHSLPFVTIQLLIDAGSSRDPAGEEGLANLTAEGLLLGTSKRTIRQINESLESVGSSLTSSCGRDYATLQLRSLKKGLREGLRIFMETATDAAFPAEEIQRKGRQILAAIRASQDRPGDVAEKALQKALFLDTPYGHPVEGTADSVPRLSREALLRFYRSTYHPNNAILAVVGDMTMDEFKSIFLPLLERWAPGKVDPKRFLVTPRQGPETIRINRPITQANIILGHEGGSRSNPDYYALAVMNYILGGGGFGSRLVEEIRIKRGLAYSVGSFFDPGKHAGSFQIHLQTKNASAREAISLSVQQMERMRKEPVPEEELEGAKRYLIGSFPMRLDTQEKLARFLAQVEYFALGLNYPEIYPSLIRSIRKEDVLRVAKKYLHPDRPVLVVVANLAEANLDQGSFVPNIPPLP